MASSAGQARFRAATDLDVPALLSMMRHLYAELYRRQGFEQRGRSLMTMPLDRKQDDT